MTWPTDEAREAVALAPHVEARVRQARADALREAQAAIKAERENVPTVVLNKGQQAAWIIGMNRAHAVVRECANRVGGAS